MGKNSLIKSTDKKGAKTKSGEEKSKTAPVKSTKKTSAKTKSTAKKSASAATPKKSAKPKATKQAAPKKVSVKELIFKKFEPLNAPSPQPVQKAKADVPDAPPIISTDDPAEAQRLRELLKAKFDMKTIKASAVAPPEPEPPASSRPEPQPGSESRPQTEAQKETPQESPSVKRVADTVQDEEDQPVIVTHTDDLEEPVSDPVKKSIKYAIAGFALLVFVIIAASVQNSSKYYIAATDDGIEIQQGHFTPMGRGLFMVLPGVAAPEETKDVYTREDVFPLVFSYYLNKADGLIEEPGLPDYEAIKSYVNQAADYAITAQMKEAVSTRLNNIDRMALLYKADVAIDKNTQSSLEAAAGYLNQASRLDNDEAQSALLNQKMNLVKERQAALAAEAAQAE